MTLQSAISLSLSDYCYEPRLHQAYEHCVISELQLTEPAVPLKFHSLTDELMKVQTSRLVKKKKYERNISVISRRMICLQ